MEGTYSLANHKTDRSQSAVYVMQPIKTTQIFRHRPEMSVLLRSQYSIIIDLCTVTKL